MDAHELFRRVAFDVGVNNTDDHLRNHDFLREKAGWRLSPAFDINPNPNPEVRRTSIAGAATQEEAAEGLDTLASVCRLKPSRARDERARIAAILERWRQTAMRNGARSSEIDMFADTFEQGIAVLRG